MRSLCLPQASWRARAHALPRCHAIKRTLFSSRGLLSPTADLARPLSESFSLYHQIAGTNLQELTGNTPSRYSSSKLAPNSKYLPVSCPGCGALTQDVDPGLAGFYTLSRKAVRKHIRGLKHGAPQEDERTGGEEDVEESRAQLPEESTQHAEHVVPEADLPPEIPVCDRCHYLIYDSRGVPIAHPTIEAIADSVAESPFARNHVYHVVDAADFPMSVIPSIYRHLSLAKPRSQNRRSQHSFSTRPSLSFIITRSDLLAPTKEMVDSMMPKFTSLLRTALGRVGRNLRLGNVHLVSSKRGWWTKDIKEAIRDRGGGNWLIGKFNVGKSNLFEVLFPKGSRDQAPSYAELQRQREIEARDKAPNASFFSEQGLLPPPQPEVAFPTLPLVSSLPGTTASPIRLPFGNNKGELIDMPGLERGGLDQYVKVEDRTDLVMVYRPTTSQYIIKPGQSLLLGGGLVRITPILDEDDRSTTMLAYPFVPLKAHVTSTEKAQGIQMQKRESGVDSILADDVGSTISQAGRFKLQTDVTKSRAGSMIRAGVNPDKLQFHVYATDILIEGVGWVELVCQVRKTKRMPHTEAPMEDACQSDVADSAAPAADAISIDTSTFTPFGGEQARFDPVPPAASNFPEIEIFTPHGKHVGQRPCMDIWQMWRSGKPQKAKRGARPRKSMTGAKKREKLARRAALKVGT